MVTPHQPDVDLSDRPEIGHSKRSQVSNQPAEPSFGRLGDTSANRGPRPVLIISQGTHIPWTTHSVLLVTGQNLAK